MWREMLSAALAAGSITGTVTDQNAGTPVAGFEVGAYAPGAASPSATSCTAADGTYTLPVAPGTYEVGFSGVSGTCGPRSTFAAEWFDGRGTREFADPVTVGDGATVPGVNASLRDGGRVSGSVRASGTPVQNVTVELLDVKSAVVMTACSAADGTYVLDPLPGGVFTARFNAAGVCGNAGQYAMQWWENSPNQAGARAVNLGYGEEIAGVDAALVAGDPGQGAHTLTVQKTGNGLVASTDFAIYCGTVCSSPFPAGSTVTLGAKAAPGSAFLGWSGAGCSGNGACAVTMNAAQTVTATFKPVPIGPPETRILKARFRRRSARFTFTGVGARFECALRKRFRTCRSPVTYKRLKRGRYVFRVRAVDGDGAVDASPARRRFRVQ